MGYQESYVRLKDNSKFDSLLNLIKELGSDFFDYSGAMPVEIITLKKPIKGTLEQMCKPRVKYHFPVGERFIYFVGERYSQRSSTDLLHNKAPNDLEIYFTECFPSDEIFDNDSGHAELIPLELEPNKVALENLMKCMECEWELKIEGIDYNIPSSGNNLDIVHIYKNGDKILASLNRHYDKELASASDIKLLMNRCNDSDVRFKPWDKIIITKEGMYKWLQNKTSGYYTSHILEDAK